MRVFISHGIAADDAAGNAFLTRLYQALDRPAEHLVAFLDRQRLQPGALWRSELHEELARCGAGIVVLSTRALQSDWVRKEAAILSWRRALARDPAFRLHVVILDGLSEVDLQRAGLGPMQLTEIQALRCGGAEAEIAQAISSALTDLRALAGLLARRADGGTPLDWLRNYLRSRLKDIDADDLQALAIDVNGVCEAGDATTLAPPACAEAIAAALLRNCFGKTATLRGFMERLDMLGVSQERRRDIFDAVSALWVDPQCAAPFHLQLDPALGPGQRERTAYIALLRPGDGVSAKFEASVLARRANPRLRGAQVVTVARPGDPERLTEIVIGRIADHFAGRPSDTNDSALSLEDRVRRLTTVDTPIYVVLNFALDEQQLEELFQRLPGFLFVGPEAERPEGFRDFQWRHVSGWRQPDQLADRRREYDDIMFASGF